VEAGRLVIDLPTEAVEALALRCRDLAQRGIELEQVAAADLALGELAGFVANLRTELTDGQGMHIVLGFPVDELSGSEIELFFWAVGLGLGRAVSQSVMGERLGHVIDVTATDPNARAYRNNSELSPHTDPADLLAFLCLESAREGGVSRFVSALAVHEEIRVRRPDLLERLYRGFRYHRTGEQPPGCPDITPHRIPVFSWAEGLLSCRYVRAYIDVAAAEDPTIELTDADLEALEFLEEIAGDPAFHVEFTLQPGEAVFANNFTVLHARTGFSDDVAAGRRRHLLRLWLAADPPRPLVADIQHFEGEPGIQPQPGKMPSHGTHSETN